MPGRVDPGSLNVLAMVGRSIAERWICANFAHYGSFIAQWRWSGEDKPVRQA
jgi:hypothetical protein